MSPSLTLIVEPEEFVVAYANAMSPAEEVRVADMLRSRRRLLSELADAIDLVLEQLDERAGRHRWTEAEIRGRTAP